MDRRRLNQSQVAEYVGLRPSGVNAWFSRGSIPKPETCRKLADYFKLPIDDVLRAAGHLPPEPGSPPPALDPRVSAIAQALIAAGDDSLEDWLELGEALARRRQSRREPPDESRE